LSLASVAWVATYYFMPLMMASQSGMMSFGVAAIVSMPTAASISLFEITWIIGMAAMMFPAMIPVVLFYNKIAAKQQSNPSVARSVGTPLFLGGYLLVYAALGMVAFLGIYVGFKLSTFLPYGAILSFVAPAAILVATGIYQFTALKTACLRNCISPMGFFALHYKPGLSGTLRMGFSHGLYCVGCCWAFMLVMLGVGAMSIPVMAVLAGVIAIEKILARGAKWFNALVAIAFVAAGILVLIFPSILLQL
jgi:predicted metal-binding membrane protein